MPITNTGTIKNAFSITLFSQQLIDRWRKSRQSRILVHKIFILERGVGEGLFLLPMIPPGLPWLLNGNGHRLKWDWGEKQSSDRRSWPALGCAYLSPCSPCRFPLLRSSYLSESLTSQTTHPSLLGRKILSIICVQAKGKASFSP